MCGRRSFLSELFALSFWDIANLVSQIFVVLRLRTLRNRDERERATQAFNFTTYVIFRSTYRQALTIALQTIGEGKGATASQPNEGSAHTATILLLRVLARRPVLLPYDRPLIHPPALPPVVQVPRGPPYLQPELEPEPRRTAFPYTSRRFLVVGRQLSTNEHDFEHSTHLIGLASETWRIRLERA